MEIEVGEYVRLTRNQGINKIIEIEDDGECYVLEKYIANEWGDDTCYLYDNEIKDKITKHSKNIIDIIEVRDIIQIKRGLHDDYNFIFICSDEDIIVAKETIEKYAINILTHEQYEANCCRLEENK